jgi:hypothetical protein
MLRDENAKGDTSAMLPLARQWRSPQGDKVVLNEDVCII